ncbi:MAG TPA: sigma-70 family RNA polymerase sigma factor [Streptosporangiaceae bacterium]|nr:sigma-70 family RNA polymerase sigma factor [Streptosporangiaceae bacterium]
MKAAEASAIAESVFGDLDRADYEALTRELTGYCYRMLGSPFDAEDAVQETMIRAWRRQDGFEGRSTLRSWVYRIATNVCIDMLRSRSRRVVPMDLQSPTSVANLRHVPAPTPEHSWVLPVPDAWTTTASTADDDPVKRVVAQESVRLAFIAALQRLTPRQRAVLILRDVLQFSAAESAELLGTTVASANSALQRARVAMPGQAGEPDDSTSTGGGADRELLDAYVAAFEAYDVVRLTTLLRDDAIQSMPPFPMWLRGPADIGQFMLGPGAECRGSRLLRTAGNGCAAFGQYRHDGNGGHKPWALQVIETDGPLISSLHCFVLMPELFTAFGLPAKL